MTDRHSAPLEVPAEDAGKAFCPNRPLIDIRTERERRAGIPSGALAMNAEKLLDKCGGDDSRFSGGYVICAEGVRSLKAVQVLRERGCHGFSSVAGGYQAWVTAGLPVIYPEGLSANQAERYARHLVMPQVGPEGQLKLLKSRMLLVGLGGLNSPVALYLAAAGVGTLGLVDFDTVERSNLQRQVIHGESSLGDNKAHSARDRLRDLNPEVETVVIERRVNAANAAELVDSWDIVIDGTDSFPSRYALNDACVRLSKPLVYGAVMRFQGQVCVFWPGFRQDRGETVEKKAAAPCFRCLLPQAPAREDAPGCSEAGVLGILPGIVGTLQANEAIKLALGVGQPLIGTLLLIDALNMDFRQMRISANPNCQACGNPA